jgi:RNA-binding protein
MKRPPTLSGKQRKALRGLAHQLSPLVQVGGKGLTDEIVGAVHQALEDHELVKVKLLETCPVGRADAATTLADGLNAHAVGEIGRVIVLYRRHPSHPTVPLG